MNPSTLQHRLADLRLLALTVAAAAVPAGAAATPACMPPVCAPSGTFDRAACEAQADWVAEGRIERVVHHPLGDPFNVDEFEFDFVPERVMQHSKPGPAPATAVHYGVGWCDNPAPQLGGAQQRYRVYGVSRAPGAAADLPNHYLWIEALP